MKNDGLFDTVWQLGQTYPGDQSNEMTIITAMCMYKCV